MTAGVETQLAGAVRVGAMFYYRTNRKQFGQHNTLQPTIGLHRAHHHRCPNGPGGTVQNPKPTTGTVFNINPAVNTLSANVRDNEDYLDTEYKGIEFTATKRFSRKWQMQTGFTIGKNTGGTTLAGGTDLNDPERDALPAGHHRQRLGDRVPPVGQLHPAR